MAAACVVVGCGTSSGSFVGTASVSSPTYMPSVNATPFRTAQPKPVVSKPAPTKPAVTKAAPVVTTPPAPVITTPPAPVYTPPPAPVYTPPPAPVYTPPPAPPGETLSQSNAVSKAQDYLDYTAFSRSGLIAQLEYEGFSVADATYAVDKISPDWNQQAVAKAKEYLDYTSFSHTGLVEQLEYEGFTPAQAEYGVSQTGL